MRQYKDLLIAVILLLSGCVYDTRERVDQTVCPLISHSFDQQPPEVVTPTHVSSAGAPGPGESNDLSTGPAIDVQATAYLAPGSQSVQPTPENGPAEERHLDLAIPREIPGSEARRLELPADPAAIRQETARLFPALPPVSAEPVSLPGPHGRPYTLTDLQQIAVANSPQLRQAASDVEAARGNMIQAGAYPNPTVSYQFTPSNDDTSPGACGLGVDQTIKTGGKLTLQTAAAEMAWRNAELALHRARSDLATQIRNAYFAVLVAKETVRVNKALARFTDEVYNLQARMVAVGQAAAYEPAALRAQAFTARLAYKQAVQTYIYSWKQLVAAMNLRQLPLSEVAGRVDSNIPYYDYDVLLAHVLRNHTDMLTSYNVIEIARYNLKLARLTPVPDVDVNLAVTKDYNAPPYATIPTLSLGVPLPVWDRSQGAIIAAEAALVRAGEEPHRVEMNLTSSLAVAYTNYKNNLDALEYYRRYILPDQVRAYRGAYNRRQIDPNASFGDVVSAQQTLSANVATYLQTLAQVWSSVTSVADLIQTDDLFQFARPQAVPPLPELGPLPPFPCSHPFAAPPDAGAAIFAGGGQSGNAEFIPLPQAVPQPGSGGSISSPGGRP
jgi:outer membrane protein, heavy metal efflux system